MLLFTAELSFFGFIFEHKLSNSLNGGPDRIASASDFQDLGVCGSTC